MFNYMRDQLGEDISSANLVISGSTSVLVRSGEELIDVLQQGQGVLNVLPLGGREGRDRRSHPGAAPGRGAATRRTTEAAAI